MIRVLIASLNKNSFDELMSEFKKNQVQLSWAESCETVISKVRKETFDLIITNEKLHDSTGIECISRLIAINPLLNCAAISSLSHDDFHENSEGLGILMQIPVNPKKNDAVKLLEHLKQILNLTKRTN